MPDNEPGTLRRGLFSILFISLAAGSVLAVFLIRDIPARIAQGDRGRLAIAVLDDVRRPFLEIHAAELLLGTTGYSESAQESLERGITRGHDLVREFEQVSEYNPALLQRVKRLEKSFDTWVEDVRAAFAHKAMVKAGSPTNEYEVAAELRILTRVDAGFSRSMDDLGRGEGPIHDDIRSGAQAVIEASVAGGVLLSSLIGLALFLQWSKNKQLGAALIDRTQISDRLCLAMSVAEMGTWKWNIAVDQDTRDANFNRILGLEAEESTYPVEDLVKRVHPADRAAVDEELKRSIRERDTYLAEYRIVRADGTEVWLRDQGLPFFDDKDEVSYMTGAVVDITDQKRIEHERLKLEAQLRQSQKMETIGQLSGGIAHDFNNLLAIVLGNLSLLEDGLSESGETSPEEVQAHIQPAILAAERGSELIQRLLAVSRQQTLDPVTLSIDTVIQDMEGLLRRALGEDIELRLAASDWLAEIDKSLFENALLNLMVNARDAMPEGGKLTIESGQTILDSEYARTHLEAEAGEYLTVAVSDTGCGMDADTLDRAFEPFFTTKDEGKGNGLGLPTVYGFAKQSNGHVTIYSEPGEGTTVTLYLPRTRVMQAEAADKVHKAHASENGGESILVVEDNDDVRRLAKQMLEILGYTVFEAANGEAALKILEFEDGIDLILTDVAMPGGMRGPDVAREAQKQKPGVKILYMSGYGQNAVLHDARLDRNVDLIGKPFSQIELSTKLREVLGSAP